MLPGLRTAAGFSYRESGWRSVPALVLLHGIGSTSAVWRLQYGPLGGHFRVVAWDAPGYGESRPLPEDSPSVEAYAEALARLLDALGIGRAIFGASSWGTPTAVKFACLYPRRALGLVLAGPVAGWRSWSAPEREKALAARIERITRLGPQTMRAEDATRLLAPGAREELLEWVRSAEGLTAAGYSQAARMLAVADVVRDIAAVRCPVTVVSGEKDIVAPPELHARRIAAAAPQARLESIPDCGHLPQLERPDRLNAVALEMLHALQVNA